LDKGDGTFTESYEETLDFLTSSFFPRATDSQTATDYFACNNHLAGPNDYPFELHELHEIIKGYNTRKAHGPDGIEAALVPHIFMVYDILLLKFYNVCLNKGIFPDSWKIAKIALIPKGTSDLSPKKPRPISLLPLLGKVYDKLLTQRVNYFLAKNGKISSNQFGFQKQKSTIDAVSSVVQTVGSECSVGYVALASHDIKGAFDHVSHLYIITQLLQMGLPKNLVMGILAFLSNRIAVLGDKEIKIERGCPQGSCLGPTLWNVAVQPLLERIESNYPDINLVAYADDLLFIITARRKMDLISNSQLISEECSSWAESAKLEFSLDKSNLLFIRSRGCKKLKTLPKLQFQGNDLIWVDQFKYLGIIIDDKFLWTPHIKYIHNKYKNICYRVFMAVKKKWGIQPNILSILFEKIITPAILYGSEIWGHKAKLKINKQRLHSLARPFLLRLTRAYKTTSHEFLHVLGNLCPLYLTALTNFRKFQKISQFQYENRVHWTKFSHPSVRLPSVKTWPTERNTSDGYIVFTDGSKDDDGHVGCGFAIWNKVVREDPIVTKGFKLPNSSTVFQSEIYAIHQGASTAFELIKNQNPAPSVSIVSDSRAALLAVVNKRNFSKSVFGAYNSLLKIENVTKLELYWTKSHANNLGNETADKIAKFSGSDGSLVISNIKTPIVQIKKELKEERNKLWQEDWCKYLRQKRKIPFITSVDSNRPFTDKKVNQLLTGHGNLNSYFKRFGMTESDLCECGETEDQIHILFNCTLETRKLAREILIGEITKRGFCWQNSSDFLPILLMSENYMYFRKFASRVIRSFTELSVDDAEL
jgi:ribonuclease HI